MRAAHAPASALRAASAPAAGALLFGTSALVEGALALTPWASGALEEGFKALVLLAFGFAGLAPRKDDGEAAGLALSRRLRGRLARALSLGLVATAVFAAIENMAYFLAFPDSGSLARLAWSLPLHLDAALLEALGALPALALAADRRAGPREGAAGAARREGSLAAALAMAWRFALLAGAAAAAAAAHAFANRLVASDPGRGLKIAGSLFLLATLAALAAAFLDIAYDGGFLHGTERRSR